MEKEKVKEKVEIQYDDSFVAFLDVLGFTDLVKNNNTDKINMYLNKVEEAMLGLKKELKNNSVEINHIIISDSIIISIEQKKDIENNIGILRNLCSTICIIQSYLSLFDIWLRGAISSGESYFNKEKNQIIGKAYINAYLLETKISNPQVIIDNRVIKELGFSNSKDFIDTINNHKDSIIREKVLYDWGNTNRIKKEFPLFIDYQSLYFQTDAHKGFGKILINIENNIYSRTNLYSKYKWVVDYILSLIDKYENDKSQSNRLNKLNEIKERLEKL
ncbi:hypothetical protein [Aliarcobacter butzleri]|uniref:hypothetical protein n=1 Tax=Aliarcobacter butzleri TaxID=28197 RepID=UPI00062E5759|nr:hypothetical protein [Aliarcobacter butzleri]KLD99249.1 hypothetical protein AF74_00440 [Aliarcobacter butzleri L349]